jgi:hypothetical protein
MASLQLQHVITAVDATEWAALVAWMNSIANQLTALGATRKDTPTKRQMVITFTQPWPVPPPWGTIPPEGVPA